MNQDPQVVLAAVVHRLNELEARVGAIEGAQRTAAQRRQDDDKLRGAARGVAVKAGLRRQVLEAGTPGERRQLSKELRGQGWTNLEIARVLHCSERSVARYFAGLVS